MILVATGLLVLAACLRRREIVATMREYFGASGSPVNLAVFRIVVFALLLHLHMDYSAAWFAEIPEALRVMPPGWGWFWRLVPWQPTFVRAMQMVCVVACIASVLGLFTRAATSIAVLTGLYVFGLQQFFGKLNHFHHLIWFGALLAASPCGDALSIDAYRRGGERPGPSRAYALPLRIACLLIGLCYFFPGLWKLWYSGRDWANGEAIRLIMHTVWYHDGGFRPFFRVDRYPWLLSLAGIGTLVFELGFVFLLFKKKTRWIAAAMGLGFHSMSLLFLHIGFYHLAACYVVFVDWAPHASGTPTTASPRPAGWVGAVLLLASIVCGSRLVDSWPFCVYPTFAHGGSPVAFEVEANFYDDAGAPVDYDPAPVVQHLWYSRWSYVKFRIASTKSERLTRATVELLRRNIPGLERATRVEIYRNVVRTDPERLAENPKRRDLILEMPLSPLTAAR